MASRNERNEQTQHKWFSRFSRERLDLSASVEATLVDETSVEPWQDDDDMQPASSRSSANTALIPPRLSLQSRPLPAVQPRMIEEIVDQSPSHNPGTLARLAQRLTSSLVALSAVMQPVAPPTLFVQEEAPLPEAKEQQDGQAHTSSRVESSYHPSMPASTQSEAVLTESTPLAAVHPGEPQQAVTEKPQALPPQPRPRLSHTTKVRLETAVLPAVTPLDTPGEEKTSEVKTEQETPTLAATTSEVQPPKTAEWNEEAEISGTTSAHLPAVDKLTGDFDKSANRTLSGSGAFETGQSDLVVSNPHVTASSVVLVMLTDNPGPVVVQYVSLQPHTGFTIHLTAPAAMRTTFNYVILLGELF